LSSFCVVFRFVPIRCGGVLNDNTTPPPLGSTDRKPAYSIIFLLNYILCVCFMCARGGRTNASCRDPRARNFFTMGRGGSLQGCAEQSVSLVSWPTCSQTQRPSSRVWPFEGGHSRVVLQRAAAAAVASLLPALAAMAGAGGESFQANRCLCHPVLLALFVIFGYYGVG